MTYYLYFDCKLNKWTLISRTSFEIISTIIIYGTIIKIYTIKVTTCLLNSSWNITLFQNYILPSTWETDGLLYLQYNKKMVLKKIKINCKLAGTTGSLWYVSEL